VGSRFRLDGLAELVDGLQKLTPELQDEGRAIVFDGADQAVNDLIAAYPVRATGLHPGPRRKSPWFSPGKLRKSLIVVKTAGQFSSLAIVKNTDPIAWLFENGSQARHLDNGKVVGAMPARHVFIPTMMRRRRAMYEQLKALVASKGITVTGDA
jgi:hypothetical protein